MPQTVNWNGKQYTKHLHNANWIAIRETNVYFKPYFESDLVYKQAKVPVNANRLYSSKWKTTINGVPWYCIPELDGGWIPWKTMGKQVLKRVGGVLFCEEEIKSFSIEESTATEKETPIPKISDFMGDGDEYKNFLRSKMIIADDSKLWNDKFNRLQFANPYNAIGTTREYLFFTKFDLHIFEPSTSKLNPELSNEPFWIEMGSKYKKVIRQIQLSASQDSMPFMPILTNAIAGPLDLPSSNGEVSETGATIYGTTMQYRQGSFKSDEGYDFSLEFYDNPSLEVYHLFKMYNEYENLKTLGMVTPPKYVTNSKENKKLNKYTVDRILHDQIGIFKIIVEDDMETILHYSYLWGCFPKSVPRDTFREVEPGLIRYSIDWHAQFVDDMQPDILIDFNTLCTNYINMKSDSESVLWDAKNGIINGNWPSSPFITISKDKTRPTGYRYKLKWFNKK